METAMRALVTVIAAMLTVGSAALAEPPKNQPAPSPSAQKAPAEVILASAETTHASAPDAGQPNAAPTKRRIARVTSCRCGDPQPDAESQEQ
jgi:hypothetical protein